MEETSGRVLVVDDDAGAGQMVAQFLGRRGYEVVRCETRADALDRADSAFDAAVLDLELGDGRGLELLDRLRESSPDLQAVILSGHAERDNVIEGLQHGIFDYLPKGESLHRLSRAVEAATAKTRLLRENRALMGRLSESNRLLRALTEMSAELVGEAHLDRILSRVVAAGKELTGAAAGRALLFVRAHGDTLVVEGASGNAADTVRGSRLQLGEGIAAFVAERGTPLLLPSAREHPSYSHRCDEFAGVAEGFLCAPLRYAGVMGALSLAGAPSGGFSPFAAEVATQLSRHAAVAVAGALAHERSLNYFTHTSEMLVSFLEGMDVHYPGHSKTVAALADMVTRRLGLGEEDRRNVHFAALLHDIGKVMVDASVLRHRGLLGAESQARLAEHPSLGTSLLQPITLWRGILPAIQSHHERFDGAGYPRGLAGEQIPLGGRIVALADAFDAMTRNPHRPSRSAAEALHEIETCAGSQFDPRLSRVFVAEYKRHGHALERYRVAPDAG